MFATVDSSCGELSEAKQLWISDCRILEEMIRDSSPAAAGIRMTRAEQHDGYSIGMLPRFSQQQMRQESATEPQNLLRGDLANLSSVGSPDCVLPDASGKFFARI